MPFLDSAVHWDGFRNGNWWRNTGAPLSLHSLRLPAWVRMAIWSALLQSKGWGTPGWLSHGTLFWKKLLNYQDWKTRAKASMWKTVLQARVIAQEGTFGKSKQKPCRVSWMWKGNHASFPRLKCIWTGDLNTHLYFRFLIFLIAFSVG